MFFGLYFGHSKNSMEKSVQFIIRVKVVINKMLLVYLDNATRFCHSNNTWDTYSDYRNCKEQCPVDPYISGSGLNITWEDCTIQHDIADISEIIYYIGMYIVQNLQKESVHLLIYTSNLVPI